MGAVVAATLAVVATVGLLDALYFVLVTYRWMRPDPRWLPRVCRMDDATCARIVDTPEARVLGLPNSVYGVAWYGVVLAAAARAFAGPLPWKVPLVLAAGGTVVFSAYLAAVLVFRLRAPCPLCFLGHACNVAILALLAVA